jgi:hypothetical protein
MARLALVLALLLPSLAVAQVAPGTMTVTESSDSLSDAKINLVECGGTAERPAVASSMTFTWNLNGLVTLTEAITSVQLRVSSDQSDCSSGTTTKLLGTFDPASGVSRTEVRQSTALIALLGLNCGEATLRNVFVCAVGVTGGTDVVRSVTIPVDTVTPAAPTGLGTTPGDGALNVSWAAVGNADRYRAEARVAGQPGTTPPVRTDDSNTTTARIEELENGTTYDVVVVAITDAGNESPASAAVQGTPVIVNDFWRLYQEQGRPGETGGCQTGRAGGLALLGVAVLLLRRRRGALLALAVATTAATALPARAVEQSGRWGSFELRAMPYRPNLDEGKRRDGAGPYEQAFGNDRRWMMRGDVAKTLFTGYGSLDLGIGVGYFQARGRGRLTGEQAGAPSSDKTTFRIIPTSLTLTYRFDVLADRWSIPLAPYGRASLERYSWWVTNGSDDTARDGQGRKGRGATNGYGFAGGVAFLLDILDRQLAGEMDDETGINSTYLYVEASKTVVDDFGSSSSWDLSPEGGWLWSGGLLLVF